MKDLGYQIIDYVVEHRLNLNSKKVFQMGSFDALSKKIKSELPLESENPVKVFEELNQLIGNNIVHTDHPRFYSFIPGPSNYYSVLAETLAVGFNVFAGHWMAASIAGMIELRTIEWLAKIVNYPEGSGGIFVSGGSMANLTALVTARDVKLGDNFSKGVVYYSDQTHSSVSKALRIIGFKPENMRKVGLNNSFQMDTNELIRNIEKDIDNEKVPFCIVGNAGTTNTGAVDNINELSRISNKFNLWLHIDAAYGGATLLSQEYKSALVDINKADSITLDPHKWWFQPYETGCLIVKDKINLKKSFAVQAEYLDDTIRDNKEINYYDYGLQLTRSFRALKLYTFFRCEGLTKIGKDVTKGIKNAEYIELLLKEEEHWEIISKATLGIVAFRVNIYKNEIDNDKINSKLSEFILNGGYSMITTTKLNEHIALRMCPINPKTTKEFIDNTFRLMNDFIKNYLQ